MTLEPGTRVDRFGSEYGSYISAADAPYSQRSLPPSNLDTPIDTSSYPYNYHVYTVRRRIEVVGGPIAPWFGQPGLGTQFYIGGVGNVRTHIARGLLTPENVTELIVGAGRGGGNQCG
ncbi:MAG: hypothetical protein Q9219_004440 [cf. Caloplaca sp. 3 TL-2023]